LEKYLSNPIPTNNLEYVSISLTLSPSLPLFSLSSCSRRLLQLFYIKLPKDFEGRRVLLFDPTLASGASSQMAIRYKEGEKRRENEWGEERRENEWGEGRRVSGEKGGE
jgi:Uracil phosphoribosyltransferase